MGNLFWLDYIILATVGLMVLTVFYFSYRDSRKRKTSRCSGRCGACSSSCEADRDSFSIGNSSNVKNDSTGDSEK